MNSWIKKLLLLALVVAMGGLVHGREGATLVAVLDYGGAGDLCALLESRVSQDSNWQVFSRQEALVGSSAPKVQPFDSPGQSPRRPPSPRVEG